MSTQLDAGWSSQVARWAHNPKVAGSNPASAIYKQKSLNLLQIEAFFVSSHFRVFLVQSLKMNQRELSFHTLIFA